MSDAVTVVAYDPRWPALFDEEKTRIAAALAGSVVAIEHIGSTSVPGLEAKPIIDILVGMRPLEVTDAQIAAMEELGYEYLGELGLPGRLFFRKGRPRSHHVHVVEWGGDQWERHLAFPDFLRRHPDEARRYGELKRRLAIDVAGDWERYMTGKEAYIDEVEERARRGRRARS